jgi:hypothetical protein
MNQDERKALTEHFASWLEQERLAAVQSLEKRGESMTKRLHRVYAKRTHTYATEERTGTWELVKTGDETLEVSRFAGLPPNVTLRWEYTTSPTSGDNNREQHKDRTSQFFRQMLGEYLTGLRLLSSPDPELAHRIINGYLDYLEATEIDRIEEMSIGGITPPEQPVESPDGSIRVRALSSEELGANLNAIFGGAFGSNDVDLSAWLEAVNRFPQRPTEFVLGCSIRTRRRHRRNDAAPEKTFMRRIVLALQLLGYSISGRGTVLSWTEPGPRAGDPPDVVLIPKQPEHEDREITADVLIESGRLAELIPVTFDTPQKREEVALHQFSVGAAHYAEADAVLAFMISLEALLVPGLQGENAYRFRLNGAKFLADRRGDRKEIYGTLKKLYEVRSKLVHGAVPNEEELKKARREARELAARGLIKALTKGWPTAAQFEDAALC